MALDPAPHAAASPRLPAPAPEPALAAAPALPASADGLHEARLARARRSLAAYLESTRYPPDSRPLAEHPDQARPHAVAEVRLPLARPDGKLTNARVTLRQDRLFLVGDERATLSIGCDDGEGPAACEIASATARVPPGEKGAAAPAPVAFASAEKGVAIGIFQPSAQGFAGHRGPIRIEVALTVAGESGGASFDLVYTPAAPAVFTGPVREALVDGSLDLHVELQVDAPGRYLITARADDADGRSFAYLAENEEIGAGRQEVRLRIFGKLVRDEGARAPFRLRDLEGFRLLEDTYPDRDLMPAREGVVYTTKGYAPGDFSDKEWESDDKARRLEELTKDARD